MAAEDVFSEKLDQLLDSNPEIKKMYDLISSLISTDESGDAELEAIEINGTDYIIIKEFTVRGTTYYHLVNEKDPLDFMFRKLSVETDGEEYLVPLDSEHEFDMVVAYEQKYIWRDLKRKQEFDAETKNE